MATRRGDTLIFPKPPVIAAHACIGGKKEGESPLAAEFDELHSDNRLGQASWEAAETQLQLQTARLCLKKAHATEKDVSLLLAGDLQAQCTASGYAARALGLPFAGLFGACSTMAEALGVGACLCSAGMADGLLAMTSSHFCTAERQFRTPLSYGAVRTPTAQWTATAAGACLLRPAGQGVGIRAVTFGRVQDLGIRDINIMRAFVRMRQYLLSHTPKKELDELRERIEYLEEDVTSDRGSYEKQFDELFSAFAKLSAAIQVKSTPMGRIEIKGFRKENDNK